jgi:hypothetical protein
LLHGFLQIVRAEGQRICLAGSELQFTRDFNDSRVFYGVGGVRHAELHQDSVQALSPFIAAGG